MTDTERIKYSFEGDSRDLQNALRGVAREIDKTDKKVGGLGESIDKFTRGGVGVKSLGNAFGVTAGIIAAGATTAAVGVTKVVGETLKLSASINKLAKEAKSLDTTVEVIQKIDGAFELLGVGGQDTVKVLQKFNKNLADAADGAGPAKDALDKLGLSAEDLVGIPLDEQLGIVADRLEVLPDISDKTQVGIDLMGRQFADLIPVFDAGGDAIRGAAKQIEDAGLITTEMAKDAENLEDQLTLLKRAGSSLKRDALSPLIPTLAGVSKNLREMMEEARGDGEFEDLGDKIDRAFREVAVPAVATLGLSIEKVWIISQPILLSWERSLLSLEIAWLSLSGQWEKATTKVAERQGVISELSDSILEMGDHLDGATERWGNLVEELLTFTDVADDASGSSGGNGLEELKEELDDATDSSDEAGDSFHSQAETISALREEYAELIRVIGELGRGEPFNFRATPDIDLNELIDSFREDLGIAVKDEEFSLEIDIDPNITNLSGKLDAVNATLFSYIKADDLFEPVELSDILISDNSGEEEIKESLEAVNSVLFDYLRIIRSVRDEHLSQEELITEKYKARVLAVINSFRELIKNEEVYGEKVVELEESLHTTLVALQMEKNEKLDELREEQAQKEQEEFDRRKAQREEEIHDIQKSALTAARYWNSSAYAITRVMKDAVDKKIEAAKEGTKEEKKAAMDAFYAAKAVALAQAAVSTSLAVINAVANTPGPVWVQIAAGVAAGVIGGIAIAEIAAETAPKLHTGGLNDDLATDATPIWAQTGEAVLNRSAVESIGEDGVNALNSGDTSLENGQMVVINKVGPRVVDAAIYESVRNRRGPVYEMARTIQPRRLGRGNPYLEE